MTLVTVTQADIDQAGPVFSLDRSPVALALQRTTGQTWFVYSTEAVRMADYAKIKLPLVAQHFGWAFQHRLNPLPLIEFNVDIPPVRKPVEAAP